MRQDSSAPQRRPAAEPATTMAAADQAAQVPRLGSFIRENLDAVVAEWETFARSLDLSKHMSASELRDHCKEMLLVVADDMDVSESDKQRNAKSKGHADSANPSDSAATSHGALRQLSGFDLVQLVSEFRALRASVLALWQKSERTGSDPLALEDNIRFNEAIDRALAESVKSYAANVVSSRDMFLAILGHDLRGPLSAVSMSALVLGKAGLSEEPRLKAAMRVERAASQMSHLITDLLEFTQSRLGGGIPIKRTRCDLGAACSEAIESIRASHPGQAVSFQAFGDLEVLADADRMQQALCNLLYNAVQHGESQAVVSLTARGETDAVVLQVGNSGRPIPAGALPFIFEPLVRAPAHGAVPLDERSRTSLGLGLFIVREIVRGHGGSITVASDRHAGTVFTIRLPRGEGPAG